MSGSWGRSTSFEGKRFKDAARGDLELGRPRAARPNARRHEAAAQGAARRCSSASRTPWASGSTEVRVSVAPDRFAGLPGARRARPGRSRCGASWRPQGQKVPDSKPVLELNVEHPLVQYLEGVADDEPVQRARAAAVRPGGAAEGGQLANPADYVRRLNRLLVRLAVPRPAHDAHGAASPRGRAPDAAGPAGDLEALIETPAAAEGSAPRRSAPSPWSAIRIRCSAAR